MANGLALDIAYDAPLKLARFFWKACSSLPRFLDKVDEIFVEP
jgi:hypothetical protein